MKKGEKFYPYLYIFPALALIIFIFLVPMVYSIAISMTNWDGLSKDIKFIGLQNYIDMLHEPVIKEVLFNNLIYFVEIVVFQNLIALIAAEFLRESFRGKEFFRAVLFLPTVICTVAVGFIWNLLLDPSSGYLPALFEWMGCESLASVIWLGNVKTAIHTISAINVWQWAGQTMVIYLAGITSIDEGLYEAAKIDGAGHFQMFYRVTLPLLAPSITINVVTSTIGTLKIFDLPFVMTKGGPGHSSESLAMTIYSNSFNYSKVGYGTAISVVLFIFVLIVSVIQMRMLRKREDDIV